MPADSRQSLSLRRIQHLSFAPVSPVKPRLQRQNLKASEAYVSALAKAPTPRDGWTSIALSASSSASCSSTHHPPGGRQAHAPVSEALETGRSPQWGPPEDRTSQKGFTGDPRRPTWPSSCARTASRPPQASPPSSPPTCLAQPSHPRPAAHRDASVALPW